ncbi:MAG: M18 family aminopeptidase [Negativibacillus sp.]|nr:M18 family aminopeptidase [Negativibacillus sp.]
MALEHVQELFDFIQQSPSCFHVIENVKKQLTEQGFEELCENKNWQIKEGGKYFVTRNLSSVIAFKVPTKDFKSFHIIASHSDSPTFKIKDHPEQMVKGKYVQLNTERYGGMIYSTWFDRPLSIAGRALVKTETGVATKLLNIDRDLLVIPNLAVHMDRTVNDGMKYNPQVNLLPLYGDAASKDTFNKLVAEACGTAEENIISTDLFLYNRTAPTVWGAHNEYMSCAKLDDLECAFSSLKAFLKGENSQSVSVCAIFDNEEVGSSTKQGANSTFMYDILQRINENLGRTEEQYHTAVASSFMLSADNAHALHPNHPAISDPTNPVYLNEGIVIKHNANQKYTTDAVSSAIFQKMCEDKNVPYQHFVNRSDVAGGSTLGNIANTHVSLNTVDIGMAQLAMHSSYETAGVLDLDYMIAGMEAFYNSAVVAQCDGAYDIL